MPSIEVNKEAWDNSYKWIASGDEWSLPWGNSTMQWYGTILPRIYSYIPAETILEIGPGYGRWSRFLLNYCKNLVLVDISPKCLDACKKRFAQEKYITYKINNGFSLDFLPEASIDFVFSFDSLVHVEHNILCKYVNQLEKILKPNGTAFIHHSNLGSFKSYFNLVSRLPRKLRRLLEHHNIIDQTHWRDISVTFNNFRQAIIDANLCCISQETVAWFTKRNIDCFTIFSKGNGISRELQFMENKEFMKEVNYIRKLSELYYAY